MCIVEGKQNNIVTLWLPAHFKIFNLCRKWEKKYFRTEDSNNLRLLGINILQFCYHIASFVFGCVHICTHVLKLLHLLSFFLQQVCTVYV